MKNILRKIAIGLLFGGYVDEGISGTTSKKRENFMKMIEDGSNKKFDLLITKEVSRFSRDTIDSLLYTRKLLEYDVCVYFLSDNIITASSDGELRLTIMSSMAQDEVRKISERTKFGFKRALEKGTVLGTDNIWGYKKNNRKLVIDEEEAPCIREIFDIYANDSKVGLKKLSILLKEQGYCNHNGNPIHPNTLKRIIQNPKYKGYYTGGLSTVVDYRSKKRNFNDQTEWKVYKDYEKVPPIVSEELWEKANQKLLSRSKKAAMYQKHQTLYALSGKLYCDKHQCGFVRKIRHYKNKDDVIYWYCADFHKSGKKNCIPACVKEDDLYDILLSIFKSYEIYKEEICEELLFFYKELSKEEENIEREAKLQNELEVLVRKKDKLLDLALDGFLSKEDLGNKKVIIETEISKIQTKLKELEGKKKKPEEKKYQDTKLKENILKQLVITKDNLENYIEELLDKIIVVEKPVEDNKKGNEVELKIILAGGKIITYGSAVKLRQLKHLLNFDRVVESKSKHENIKSLTKTLSLRIYSSAKNFYYKNFSVEWEHSACRMLPLCHSHAHG